MNTLEQKKIELDTYCNCRYCEPCGMGTESLSCDECKQETREIGYCDGFCWEYKVEWLDEALGEWYPLVGEPSHLRLDGSRMGWQSRSGYKVITASRRELLDTLLSVGDARLVFIFDGASLTVTRSSHDEPMGARFTITPAPMCGDCLYPAQECECA
jgi:hypothetical protein